MFDFVNEVAERVSKIIPAARLETEAYVWSIAPPTGIRHDADLLQRVQIARFNLDYVIFMRAAGYRDDARRAGAPWDLDLVRRK